MAVNATTEDKRGETGARRFERRGVVWAAVLAIGVGSLILIGWKFDFTLLKSIRPDWIAVQPNAAVAFILIGIALLFSGLSAPRAAKLAVVPFRLARLCGWLAGLLGWLTLFEYASGWNSGLDQLLFREAVYPVGTLYHGRMAPDAALCFVLLTAALEIARSSWRIKWALFVSATLGALVGTVAVVEALSHLTPSIRAYGWGGLTMMALPTAVVFAVLGAALIRDAWYENLSIPGLPVNRFESFDRRTWFLFILVFLFLAAGIFATGIFYYQIYEQHFRDAREREIYAIAELKVDELWQYRDERLGDAASFFKNTAFSDLVRRFFERATDVQVREQLRAWLTRYQDNYKYYNVVLLDAQGIERLSSRAEATLVGAAVLQGARQVLQSRKIAFVDFYRNEQDQQIYLAVLAPILDEPETQQPLGVVVLQIDPTRYLYPRLKRWPTLSQTSETLLVRREEPDVVFLNDLRFQTNTALNLRAALTRTELTVTQAALGREGILEGRGYRGALAVAALRSIPNSPWALVAQMDAAEVYAPMRERLWQAVILISSLLFGVVSCVGLIWRKQTVRHYQKQAEVGKQLRESEVRYRRLFETTKDGILIVNADTGVINDVNPFLQDMLGYSHEMLLGKVIWELPCFRDIIPSQARFLELQQKGYVRYDDLLLETGDGRQVLVEFISNLYAVDQHKVIQCNIRDITGRRQAEAALRASEDRFRTLADMAPAAILIQTNNRFAYINAAGVRLFGATGPDELLGQSVLDRIHPDFHARARERNRLLCEQLRDVPEMDQVFLRMNGSPVDVSVSAVPFTYQGQNGALEFVHDITERKQSEQQLRDSNRQLNAALTELRNTQRQIIQQENLRALGQMASGIAHDFNNALAPILGFSELLLAKPESLADQKKATKYLHIINTCANDAASVVRQMREFGRKRDTGEGQKTLNLNELVLQTIEHTRPRWKDQAQSSGRFIQIKTDLQTVPAITGEEFAFREILTNLILNAVDAMPKGGTITLGTMVEGEFIRLWVRDTGTGMTDEVRQRCFEPFFTTKDATGTGLGLTTLYGIVQRHGGTVEVESKLGDGSTFIIRLPVGPVKPVSTVPVEVPIMERKLHVLVVDDDPSLCDIAEASLINDGHTVAIAYDGATALAQVQAGPFDLVITDKAMPEMNGEQLAEAIHRSLPGLPVILMTGFGDLMKTAGELPPHITAILSKPFTQAMLRSALAGALAAGGSQRQTG